MSLDTAAYIGGFDTAKPAGADPKSEGDDNFRHIKTVLKTTFPNVTGAVTVTHTELNLLAGMSAVAPTANAIFAGSLRLSSGVMALGGSASTSFISQGLVIDQGTNDDEVLSLRSTDVAHGVTTLANTVSFGTFKKQNAAAGGLNVTGYTSADAGVSIRGVVTNEIGTRTTASGAAVVISGALKSGTTSTTMSADKNILVLTDGTNTRFIFDSDGDSHQDVGTAWTNYDHLDDVATLDAIAYNVARADDPIKRKFGEWMNERRDALTEQKLVKFNDDGHHFVNMSKLTMLHTGAIRQMGEKLDAAMQVIEKLNTQLLEMKNA